ncbi:hypothetical protein QE370_000447 [Aeromicrobium sp. SORGH_AS981]|uniref:phage portal protein n=1 Tax=Aeromicrobium sp. SORGH_AS_0981 TaxID=3041802 RepID=UPI00285DFCDA|nr:phage portal protein [Aeromicrobium sp. SORGH_AS_0981]MDR6117263.1 hypothetical protein [Aeromicrobium sp. SORGH_AS_0981]
MDQSTALDRLIIGAGEISRKKTDWEHRDGYFHGTKQRLPFAPEGVSQEYMELREQAPANWLGLAMNTPVQRISVEGFKKPGQARPDSKFWENAWVANGMQRAFRLALQAMMVHDFGVLSAWENVDKRSQPISRVESGSRIHLERDPQDPTRTAWAVKTYTERIRAKSQLVLPANLQASVAQSREWGFVYDDHTWFRFYRDNGSGMWVYAADGVNPLGECPFTPLSLNADANGDLYPSIVPLIPQQDALNTIRFNTLLAMQFSAYRQRVFTAYDPVIKDEDGKIVWQKNADGTIKLDTQGQPMPLLSSPGRIGVDRALVFPGKDTRVFDLPESDLNNYVVVLQEFLTQLFATGQIPPQYLLNKMANLSGDAMAGAESTLQALISDIWQVVDDALVDHARKLTRAAGQSVGKGHTVVRGDGEVRSFAQMIDAIVKLVQVGLPRQSAFEMVPGATPWVVEDWMKLAEQEARSPYLQTLDAKDAADAEAAAALGGD